LETSLIMWIAGEVSGDALAARNLVEGLRA
jgi:lipid A disaccharide synthetase